MQINRLFQMIYLLLERESITAKELSERFEVSTRTIYRDLEVLSGAGIPVYAVKGRGGGIRILPGFVLDKSMLSQEEQSGILSALQGLRAVGDQDMGQVLEKMSSLFQRSEEPWVAVDFSGWSDRKQVFEQLKSAVQNKRVICFDYYGINRQVNRRAVEPLQLYFKSTSWYLKGYCKKAEGMRMFRLSRIHNLGVTEARFSRVLSGTEDLDPTNWEQENSVPLKLWVDQRYTYRVYDDFDPVNLEVQADGSFLATAFFPADQWAVGFVLSYGGGMRVLEPDFFREAVQKEAREILKKYQEDF